MFGELRHGQSNVHEHRHDRLNPRRKNVLVYNERERGDGQWPIQKVRCLEALRSEEEIKEANAVDITVCSGDAKIRASGRFARRAS